jgi:hypothetical protein
MAERTAAAIASDSRRFHVNDLGWLHWVAHVPSKVRGPQLSHIDRRCGSIDHDGNG